MKNVYHEFGMDSPWEEEPPETHPIYLKNHNEGVIIVVIYLIIIGAILVFSLGRYYTDFVFWSFQFIALLTLICVASFMWYMAMRGWRNTAIGVGVLFVIIYAIATFIVLENRKNYIDSFTPV